MVILASLLWAWSGNISPLGQNNGENDGNVLPFAYATKNFVLKLVNSISGYLSYRTLKFAVPR